MGIRLKQLLGKSKIFYLMNLRDKIETFVAAVLSCNYYFLFI